MGLFDQIGGRYVKEFAKEEESIRDETGLRSILNRRSREIISQDLKFVVMAKGRQSFGTGLLRKP